jgi:hypothetical protein
MRRSPCSRVAAPSPNATGGTVWLKRTSASCNLCWRSFKNCCLRADGCGSPTNLFQPQGLTASLARGDHVDVSGAKLSRPSLHRVGRYRDQHPDLRGSSSWDRSESWLMPGPTEGRGRQPPGESARTRFWLHVPISISQCTYVLLQGIGCTHSAP